MYAVLLSTPRYRIFFTVRDMPFILGQPSRPVTEVEVITPQDTWDLDLESLHQIVMIYRETEANSACRSIQSFPQWLGCGDGR